MSCGKRFDPLTSDGDFDFNCPECGSQLTSPNAHTLTSKDVNLEFLERDLDLLWSLMVKILNN